jgi:polar amino acid transport system substrate-binding protein
MKAITLALALVLVVAGCSSATNAVGDQNPTAVQPMPEGAKVVTSLPEPSVDTSCGDPRASLRPTGPLPAPGAFPAGSTMATIRDRGRLIVGVDQNTYGFAFRDSESGEIQGFALEIASEIARAIFGDPKDRVQLTVLTSAQRIPAVENGDVDLVVHSMTTNCERWEKVDFSAVFYQAEQRVLVRKSVAEEYTGREWLAGKRVCATEGSTSLARIVNLDEVSPKPVGVQVAAWTDCLVMMQQYQVDAISTDDTILAGLQFQDPFVTMANDEFAEEPYAIAMPKDHPEFVRFVNAVLEKIKADGTWTRLYDEWLKPLLKVDATPPVALYQG